MKTKYDRLMPFLSRPLFRLAALFALFLCFVGNVALGALPAPLPIPDSLDSGDSGKGQSTNSQERQEANRQTVDAVPAMDALPTPPPVPDAQKDAGSAQTVAPPAAPKAEPALPAPPQHSAVSEPATTPPTNQDIAATVANFLQNPTSADEAVKLFRTADATPNKTDKDYEALHRLLWYAWQLGNTDAAFVYGRLFDPLEPQWWTVKKDAERALEFYQSVALQNQEAQAAMNRLRDWMRQTMPKQ
jgi:hypothetical protein